MAAASVGEVSKFREFLDAHLDQEMLRFTTAGSVDDGKSTLIGRLLHDTKSVYEDQLASIRASRVNRSGGVGGPFAADRWLEGGARARHHD